MENSPYLHWDMAKGALYYSPVVDLYLNFTVELSLWEDDGAGISHGRFPPIPGNEGSNITGFLRKDYLLPKTLHGEQVLTLTVYDRCGNHINRSIRIVPDGDKPACAYYGLSNAFPGAYLGEQPWTLYTSILEKGDSFRFIMVNITDNASGILYVDTPPIYDNPGGPKLTEGGYWEGKYTVSVNGKLEGVYTFKVMDNVSNVLEIDLIVVAVDAIDEPLVSHIPGANGEDVDENGNISFSISGVDSPIEANLFYRTMTGETWIFLGSYVPGGNNNFNISIFTEEEMKKPGTKRRLEFQIRDKLGNSATSSLLPVEVPGLKEGAGEDEDKGFLDEYIVLVAFIVILLILFLSLFFIVLPSRGPEPKPGETVISGGGGKKDPKERETDEGGSVKRSKVRSEKLEGRGRETEWDDDEDDENDIPVYYEIYEAERKARCRLCRSTIGLGIPVFECGCGKKYHLECMETVTECPACGYLPPHSVIEEELDHYEHGGEDVEDEWEDDDEEGDEAEENEADTEEEDLLDDEEEDEGGMDAEDGKGDGHDERARVYGSEDEEELGFECPDCGASLREEDNVCSTCGAEFEEDDDEEVDEDNYGEEDDDEKVDVDNYEEEGAIEDEGGGEGEFFELVEADEEEEFFEMEEGEFELYEE